MNNMLSKMKRSVELRGFNGPAVHDVRSSLLTFRTYKYVLMVVLIAVLYYGLIASDIYVARAQLYVKSTDNASVVAQFQFPGAPGQAAVKDVQLIDAFIGSQAMLDIVEEKLNFSDHFASDQWDFYARMSANPTAEQKLAYFKKHLFAFFNQDSGIITIKAKAFTPEFSLKLVEVAIKASEDFINGIGQKIALEEIAFVEKEMTRSHENLQKVRAKLLRFQNENGILSAESAGATRQGIVNEMESSLVRLGTEEKTLSSYLNENASELVALRARKKAITEQLAIEHEKLASQNGVSANDINAAYEALSLELKFATDLYKATLISLERARVESYKKLKHLVVVQAPQLPDAAIEPRKLYNIATLFVALSLAYGIIAMIIATIREHRDV